MKTLFLTGWIQVVLVAINTWQIPNEKYIGSVFVGFLISFVWTFNVKKIAFGTLLDRVVYSSGAMVGVLSGMLIIKAIY
jgi:hypothetical protein